MDRVLGEHHAESASQGQRGQDPEGDLLAAAGVDDRSRVARIRQQVDHRAPPTAGKTPPGSVPSDVAPGGVPGAALPVTLPAGGTVEVSTWRLVTSACSGRFMSAEA